MGPDLIQCTLTFIYSEMSSSAAVLMFECKWGGTMYTLTFESAESTVGDLQQKLFTMTAVLPADQVL